MVDYTGLGVVEIKTSLPKLTGCHLGQVRVPFGTGSWVPDATDGGAFYGRWQVKENTKDSFRTGLKVPFRAGCLLRQVPPKTGFTVLDPV